jgi:beta-glucosidase
MQDGPQGFRTTTKTGGDGTTTAWPSALSIAASWDTSLLYKWAAAMATEFRDKGANVALAPGIGMARVANAGRNFEYLCGEDPVLGAKLVGSVVTGIQDQGIIANAKHWINNEIEDQRKKVSANVNERVRFELYYPPFQAAIDAGVLSAMCAYNRVNDVYACENPETLSHLKDTLGFQGWVMSDWTATHSTTDSVLAGLDQEMPIGLYYSQNRLESALDQGQINMTNIDNSVGRILTSMYAIGLFDRDPVGDPMANVTSEAHNQLAREIAAKSTVLAKNDENLLPLYLLGECVAVFGDETTVSGGGSGHVNPAYVITPAQGIANALVGTSTQVIYNAGTDLAEVTKLAQQCGTAVVVVATTSSEGSDRANLSLGNGQDELVTTVAAANPRTIVSVRSPGAVLMPWVDQVPAVLLSWLGGQEAGNGLADVLFGKVNPSARTPVTMPNKDNEVGFTEAEYPGVGTPPEATYLEELLIGYRYVSQY